jgi:glycosyltransferase involved in cell wall biosynthesis
MSTHSPVKWQLDEILLRNTNVYLNGWMIISGNDLTSLVLQLIDQKSTVIGEVALLISMPRPDVRQAFPSFLEAFNSGFVGIGSWPRKPQQGDGLILKGLLESGDAFALKISPDRWEWMLSPSSWQQKSAALSQWKNYAIRAWRLFRSGNVQSLSEKIFRQLRDRPKRQIGRKLRDEIFQTLGARLEGEFYLIVDHRLGGGANSYSDSLVRSWLDQGATVLQLSYHIASLEAILVVQVGQVKEVFALGDLLNLPDVLADIPLTSIYYNNAVSFADAEYLSGVLLRLKAHHHARLVILLHDYFLICPSHFLLNFEGRFCGIPDLATCRQCLRKNPYGFTSLYQGDVASWRKAWGPTLHEADEIVAFSASSIELFRNAYQSWSDGQDWLQNRSISLVPHSISALQLKPLIIDKPANLVIGIVGQIGYHKGARVVQELAQLIERDGGGERIVIIGTLELRVNPNIVHQTGLYQRQQLPETIKKSGANIMLFPSVWPETFSYVTQELIELDLPLACMNLGAPAERVSTYSKGLVLQSTDPKRILKELRAFFSICYT